jgi:hypothetical protein
LFASGEFRTLVWIDADAIIVDPRQDIASELPETKNLQLVAHKYGGQTVPNAGVMVLHNSDWTMSFLNQIYDQHDLIDHKWWENAALLRLLGYSTEEPVSKFRATDHDVHIGELSTRWNAFHLSPHHSPSILHFPGLPHHVRVAAMSRVSTTPTDVIRIMNDPYWVL